MAESARSSHAKLIHVRFADDAASYTTINKLVNMLEAKEALSTDKYTFIYESLHHCGCVWWHVVLEHLRSACQGMASHSETFGNEFERLKWKITA